VPIEREEVSRLAVERQILPLNGTDVTSGRYAGRTGLLNGNAGPGGGWLGHLSVVGICRDCQEESED